MREVSILWTGGWDSTFRVVELSFENVEIFPIYVVDKKRKSTSIEIYRMNEIINILKSKPLTKACIHEIEMIQRDDIPEDFEITNAYKIIHERTNLGSQHEWLARLGKFKPGMEMGTEAGKPETSHIIQAIQEFGELAFENGVGYLNPDLSSNEGMLVLGWFRFPIITRTENDMFQLIKKWGYEDVMEKIWFCHTPINGTPCGCCHPCEVKMESDMDFLLPKDAQKRYRICHTVTRVMGKKIGKYTKNILRKFV